MIGMTGNSGMETTKKASKRLYSFHEARKIARGHGFDSKDEFIEYECAGAYQLPKDADVVWKEVRFLFFLSRQMRDELFETYHDVQQQPFMNTLYLYTCASDILYISHIRHSK